MRDEELLIHLERLESHDAAFHTQLNFDNWDISDENIEFLANYLPVCPKLLKVSVDSNLISSRGCVVLCNILLTNAPNLQQLILSNNNIDSTGAVAVAELVEKSKYLTTLVVSNNLLEDRGCAPIFESLALAENMQYLDMCNCDMTDESAYLLAEVLPSMKSLSTLLLDGNSRITNDMRVELHDIASRMGSINVCTIPAFERKKVKEREYTIDEKLDILEKRGEDARLKDSKGFSVSIAGSLGQSKADFGLSKSDYSIHQGDDV